MIKNIINRKLYETVVSPSLLKTKHSGLRATQELCGYIDNLPESASQIISYIDCRCSSNAVDSQVTNIPTESTSVHKFYINNKHTSGIQNNWYHKINSTILYNSIMYNSVPVFVLGLYDKKYN